jgi:purine-binding chemotaxis protein CheW
MGKRKLIRRGGIMAEAMEGPIGSGEDGSSDAGSMSAHYVGFRLGGQHYALPLEYVERALRMVAITPVPEAPPWVVGVINVHGRVVPVLDLRWRLRLPAREPGLDDRLLIVQVGGHTLALVVDRVTEVLEVSGHQVEPPPEPVNYSRPLAAVIRQEGVLVLVLDVVWLLPPEEEIEETWDLARGLPRMEEIHDGMGEIHDGEGDDLTRIKGIGRVYASRLASGGVCTFAALARADAEQVAKLIGASEGRLPAIQRWINQAVELIGEQSPEDGTARDT